jgi:hypothetical protein
MPNFKLTKDHIKLLQNAYVDWYDCETGAPAIDCKRPYGNKYVPGDIAKILGWKVHENGLTDAQEDKAYQIHSETQTALQIVLTTKRFSPGLYESQSYQARSWKKVK